MPGCAKTGAISGAVITGINTVLADDCQLNACASCQAMHGCACGAAGGSAGFRPPRPAAADGKILAQPEEVMFMGHSAQELADLGVT